MDNKEKQQKLEHFFAQWGVSAEALRQSFYDMFTDDCVFTNPGFPDCHGPKDTDEKMIAPCGTLIEQDTIKVDIRTILVEGNTAFHERVDHIIRKDGSTVISIEVTGVMELTDDGRVKRWREYFDTKPIMELVEANTTAG